MIFIVDTTLAILHYPILFILLVLVLYPIVLIWLGLVWLSFIPKLSLYLDKARPKTTQGKALKILFNEAIKVCKTSGYDTLQAHSYSRSYSELLHKHFHFFLNRDIDQLSLEIKDGTVYTEENKSIT
jgi:hypothetical protein